MLARPHRLRASADIAKVYRRGAYGSSGGTLSAKAAKSGRLVSRAVIVVGKKINKRAVVRNRIRRRLSELLRSIWTTVEPGYDIVITVHSDISELVSPTLAEHLTKALSRAGVIISEPQTHV